MPPDRGMQVLELKLSILISGPGQRRNPALDVLTGRVPDERLITLQAGLSASRAQLSPSEPLPTEKLVPFGDTAPEVTDASCRPTTAMVLPVAAIRMAAVARSTRPAPSPWLQSANAGQARLRLVTPPASRWTKIPLLKGLVIWLRAEFRPYTLRGRSPRAHLAS